MPSIWTVKQSPRDPSPKATSILLIEENQLLVDLLMLHFADHGEIRLLQPDGLPQIERVIAETKPDLALIGYEKFTPKCAQALLRLPIFASSTGVAILANEVDKAAMLSVIDAGGMGVILKSMPLRSFVSAVQFMAAGEVFVPPRIFASAGTAPVARRPPTESLGQYEVKILNLIRAGLMNREIAAEIDAPETTVKMHIRPIFAKLGAKNRTQAVSLCEDLGLI